MEAARYSIDCERSRLAIYTRAVGILSRLAHDLEIEARPASGTGVRTGSSWSAEVVVRADALRVAGVVRRGRTEAGVLSQRDVGDIERRIREEVLVALPEVHASARGTEREGDLTVRGARGEVRVPLRLATLGFDAAEVVAEGRCVLSLRALGLPEVRGPLGAFRVDDAVEMEFRVVFTAA